jgi:signal transduction histidine kinase
LAPADVCDIVEDVRERHGAQGATIEVTRPDQPLVASVDRPRMEQVIENLVENALKYGRDAEPPEIVVDGDGRELRIAVVDHGIGIPDGERDRIFERFFRASNVQGITDTGLGLGLYICHRVVEQHGGRIWHEPTPGGGSTFVVALPLLARAEQDAPVDEPGAASWRPTVSSEAIADA